MREIDKESDTLERAIKATLSPFVRVLVAIRSSFLAFVTTIGTIFLLTSFVLSGLVLPGIYYGILAAMSFVCAISAYLYAVGGYLGLRLIGYTG